MGPIETRLESKIKLSFAPSHLELENESRKHAVPKNSETHFRAVVVSEKFDGVSRIQRQRMVLEAVALEMKEAVHAFTMRCLTPTEWAAGEAKDFASPPCHGGSKNT